MKRFLKIINSCIFENNFFVFQSCRGELEHNLCSSSPSYPNSLISPSKNQIKRSSSGTWRQRSYTTVKQKEKEKSPATGRAPTSHHHNDLPMSLPPPHPPPFSPPFIFPPSPSPLPPSRPLHFQALQTPPPATNSSDDL